MKRRFTKLPIASIAVVVGSLLVGLSLSSVDAQSTLTNGQVTVRSDGAVYLISNGMRRWVATVVITDDELNAYPEAEPIYSGLAPFGSASAGTASTAPAASKTGTTASKTGTHDGLEDRDHRRLEDRDHRCLEDGHDGGVKDGDRDQRTKWRKARWSSIPPPVRTRRTRTIRPWPPRRAPSIRPAKAEPTDSTTCPESHKVKGGFDKKYYDVDRRDTAAEVELASGLARTRATTGTRKPRRTNREAVARDVTPGGLSTVCAWCVRATVTFLTASVSEPTMAGGRLADARGED